MKQKTVLVAFGIFLMFAGAAGGVMILVSGQREETEPPLTLSPPPQSETQIQPSPEPSAPKPVQKPAGQKLPPYKGDDIANIGNDPFIAKIPENLVRRYTEELERFKAALTGNPEDAEGWATVGVIKKIFNNYAGARDAWEYAKLVNPRYVNPYANLGDLYSGYLPDFPKAEANYLKTLELDPVTPEYFLATADFYMVFYREKFDEAQKVLLQGLEQNPQNVPIYYRLFRYYREKGDAEQSAHYLAEAKRIESLPPY